MREMDVRSKHFFLGDHLIKILTIFSFVYVMILLGESWLLKVTLAVAELGEGPGAAGPSYF